MSLTRRIHFTGGPASGKTTVARRVSAGLGLPLFELDQVLRDADDDVERVRSENRVSGIAGQPAWVSEGVYFDWTRPLLERADMIVWLGVSWRVASYRIIVRHLKADIRRSNQYPGWRKLKKFWTWSYRYYHDSHAHTLNEWGAPLTRSHALKELRRYGNKLVVCRTMREVSRTLLSGDSSK